MFKDYHFFTLRSTYVTWSTPTYHIWLICYWPPRMLSPLAPKLQSSLPPPLQFQLLWRQFISTDNHTMCTVYHTMPMYRVQHKKRAKEQHNLIYIFTIFPTTNPPLSFPHTTSTPILISALLVLFLFTHPQLHYMTHSREHLVMLLNTINIATLYFLLRATKPFEKHHFLLKSATCTHFHDKTPNLEYPLVIISCHTPSPHIGICCESHNHILLSTFIIKWLKSPYQWPHRDSIVSPHIIKSPYWHPAWTTI